MPVRPPLQERHHDYVLGPNQDSRLLSVAAGSVIEKVKLVLDSDAPFMLRSRALRAAYSIDGEELEQDALAGIATRWAGPAGDYRQQTFIPERLQMANYGQLGNPGPVFPPILYPANGVIEIDIYNAGEVDATNLTFYWRGVKLFPWGSVPAYTYPPRMASLSFVYPVQQLALGFNEIRQNQMFTVKPDADFAIRGGQATAPLTAGDGDRVSANISVLFKDFNKKPYSNDYVPLDILFGAGSWPSTIPIGPTPSFIAPFGPGPSQPGLFYPEIYLPANHQLLYDIKRDDPNSQPEDITFNLIGAKVFPK